MPALYHRHAKSAYLQCFRQSSRLFIAWYYSIDYVLDNRVIVYDLAIVERSECGFLSQSTIIQLMLLNLLR